MPKKTDLAYAFDLPPKDAVAYLKSKGYQITGNWQELWQQAHARAFTVAQASRLDILKAIRGEVEAALEQGLTEYEFKKRLTPKLKKLGWWGQEPVLDEQGEPLMGGNGQPMMRQLGSPYRLRTIYRVNTQTAYMAGRYRQMLANAKYRPFWMYVAVMDEATRPKHRLLNGLVFRFDDPIWQWIYPPNDWLCRCRVRALSEAKLKRLGLKVSKSDGMLSHKVVDAGMDKVTGEAYQAQVTTVTTELGSMTTAPGWNHNVGSAAYGTDMALAQKLGQLQDTEVRTQAVQALNNSELRHQVFAQWAEQVLSERRAGHDVQVVGFLEEALAEQVQTRTGQAPARVMVIGAKQLLHADSDKHQRLGLTLSDEQYQVLPKMLAKPEAVLWDKQHQNLLYLYPSPGEEKDGIKIALNAPYKLKKHQQLLDVVVNVYRVRIESLKPGLFEVLQGKLW